MTYIVLLSNSHVHIKIYKRNITYFEFSGMIVDRDGLNIRSRSVSMKVLGPAHQPKQHRIKCRFLFGDTPKYILATNKIIRYSK